jgi:hypothetical protein
MINYNGTAKSNPWSWVVHGVQILNLCMLNATVNIIIELAR